jgi:hypothetical protein
MHTETPTKPKESKRTQPRKKAHRKITELQLTEGTKRMLMQHLQMLEKAMIRAKNDLDNFVMESVVQDVIEAANAKMDPSMQQTSLVIYESDGSSRFSINQQVNRGFDDRSLQAVANISDFIRSNKKTTSKKLGFLVSMMEAMLFGASRKKKLRMTPELQKFMAMKDEEIPDQRLIDARDVLNASFYTSRSKWYYGTEVWDEKQQKYLKLEDYITL